MNLTEERTKTGVIRRIRDWKARLESLFDQIENWISDPAIEIKRFSVPHGDEGIARKLKVKFGKVPALTLLKGEHRIAFIPSVLFIIGADGRVNISTDKELLMLLDMRESPDLKSDWRIVDSDIRVGSRKFDRAALKRIIERTL
jgi:hypothetical protein